MSENGTTQNQNDSVSSELWGEDNSDKLKDQLAEEEKSQEVAVVRMETDRDAKIKLQNLHDELRELCGLSGVITNDGRARRRQIVEHIREIQDNCIEVQKKILKEALENKRIDDLTKIMKDRLVLLTDGLTELSRKKIKALVDWVKDCEKDEEMIQGREIKNQEDVQKLMETSKNVKKNIYDFIASIGVEFQNDLQRCKELNADLVKKAKLLPQKIKFATFYIV